LGGKPISGVVQGRLLVCKKEGDPLPKKITRKARQKKGGNTTGLLGGGKRSGGHARVSSLNILGWQERPGTIEGGFGEVKTIKDRHTPSGRQRTFWVQTVSCPRKLFPSHHVQCGKKLITREKNVFTHGQMGKNWEKTQKRKGHHVGTQAR